MREGYIQQVDWTFILWHKVSDHIPQRLNFFNSLSNGREYKHKGPYRPNVRNFTDTVAFMKIELGVRLHSTFPCKLLSIHYHMAMIFFCILNILQFSFYKLQYTAYTLISHSVKLHCFFLLVNTAMFHKWVMWLWCKLHPLLVDFKCESGNKSCPRVHSLKK